MQWRSTNDCAEKEWYLSKNQNIGCSSWPGEKSLGKRALKRCDIWFWKSPGCLLGELTLHSVACFRVYSKFNFIALDASCYTLPSLLPRSGSPFSFRWQRHAQCDRSDRPEQKFISRRKWAATPNAWGMKMLLLPFLTATKYFKCIWNQKVR